MIAKNIKHHPTTSNNSTNVHGRMAHMTHMLHMPHRRTVSSRSRPSRRDHSRRVPKVQSWRCKTYHQSHIICTYHINSTMELMMMMMMTTTTTTTTTTHTQICIYIILYIYMNDIDGQIMLQCPCPKASRLSIAFTRYKWMRNTPSTVLSISSR